MNNLHPASGDKKNAAIIGISMLNSHFTQKNIKKTAENMRDEYKKLFFMLPDKPALHTLAGYGYSEEESAKTVNRKFKTIERDCRNSIEALRLDGKILRWEQLEQNEFYQETLTILMDLYKTDAAFKTEADTTTRAMYEKSAHPKKKRISLDEQIAAGIPFLLKELAFIVSSPKILNVEKTEYLYHKDMPILTDLLGGKYSFQPSKDVTFGKIDEKTLRKSSDNPS